MSEKLHLGLLTSLVLVCMTGSAYGDRIIPTPIAGGPDYYKFTTADYATPDVIKGIYRELRIYRAYGGTNHSYLLNSSVTRVKFSCSALSPNSASIDPVATAWSAQMLLTSDFRLRGTNTIYVPPGGSNTVTVYGTLLSIEQDVYMNWVPSEGTLKVTVMPIALNDSPEKINFDYNVKATTETAWAPSATSSYSFNPADGFNVALSRKIGTSKMQLLIDGNPGWLQIGGMWAHRINDNWVEIGFGASFVTDAQYDVTRSVVNNTATCEYTYKTWNSLKTEILTSPRGSSESTQCNLESANFLANVHWRASAGTVSEWPGAGGVEEPPPESPQPVGQSYKHFFQIDPVARTVRMIDRFASFHNWGLSVTSAAGFAGFPAFDIGSLTSGADTQSYRLYSY